jgi:RNA polymerase sigma-70 factor (ECF subfamily)
MGGGGALRHSEGAVSADPGGKTGLDNEADLVARSVQRDAVAFGRLYEAHLDRIYRYVYFRVGSTSEAEDLTEQVFLRAWEAIDRYEARGTPFTAWLYRLAHNLVIDHYRARRPTTPLDEIAETEELGFDVVATVEDLLDAEEVREALRRLSPEHQQLVVLRFVEELSHSEVAQILGKTEGATRVIQHRALQALARALRERENSGTSTARRRPPG